MRAKSESSRNTVQCKLTWHTDEQTISFSCDYFVITIMLFMCDTARQAKHQLAFSFLPNPLPLSTLATQAKHHKNLVTTYPWLHTLFAYNHPLKGSCAYALLVVFINVSLPESFFRHDGFLIFLNIRKPSYIYVIILIKRLQEWKGKKIIFHVSD